MIPSGPNSYYDDYARKRGSSRIIHDPPSLLTDRGAYVNFLEVQLERVSAACLAVQAHEQQFNDFHNKIATIDDKISTMTRLVGLAQQCTEEVRLESNDKYAHLNKKANQEHSEMISSLQAITDRISNMEKGLNTSFGSIIPRLDILENKINDIEQERQLEKELNQKEMSILKQRLSSLESNHIESNRKIEALLTHIDKLENTIHDNDRKTAASIQAVEHLTSESLSRIQMDCQSKIDMNGKKLDDRLLQLENDVYGNEHKWNEKLMKHEDYVNNKVASVEDHMYDLDKRYCQNIDDLNQSFNDQMKEKHHILENMLLVQEGLKQQQERILSDSKNQNQYVDNELQSIHNIINQTSNAIIDKLSEKIDYDEKTFDMYSNEINQLKESVANVQHDMTSLDLSTQQHLQPMIREQVRDVLEKEISLSKTLADVMIAARDSQSADQRKSVAQLSPIRPTRSNSGDKKDIKASKQQQGKHSDAFDFSLSDVEDETGGQSDNQQAQLPNDVKDILSNFLDVYLHDQQAIKERLNELTEASRRSGSPNAKVTTGPADSRTIRPSSTGAASKAEKSLKPEAGARPKPLQPLAATMPREKTSPSSRVTPSTTLREPFAKTESTRDSPKSIPVSGVDSPPARISPSLMVSKLGPQRSQSIPGSNAGIESNKPIKLPTTRTTSPRRSSTPEIASGMTVKPRDELSYLPQYTSKKSKDDEDELMHIPPDLETSLGLNDNRRHSNNVESQDDDEDMNKETFISDSYEEQDDEEYADYDDEGEAAYIDRSEPSTFYDSLSAPITQTKIPKSQRMSDSSPGSSRSPTPVMNIPVSTDKPTTPCRQSSRHRGKLESKPSPFKDPLSRPMPKPKPQSKKEKSTRLDVKKSPTGSEASISTSTSTTTSLTTLTPSGMNPAGMNYPPNSLDHHLLGAAVRVKSNAPTRDATFTQG